MAKKPKKIPISNILRQNVHGHPFSSKYVNDDWGTIAFSIPRNELHKAFIEDEFYYSCIYFLIGQRDGKEVTYVGQTDKHNDPKKTAIQRILDHNKNILEKYYNDWNAIVLVTNKNDTWNAADLKALENAFYHEIPADIRLNGLEPNSGRPDFSKYTDKIDQIKSYITSIGYNVFPEYDENTDIGIIDEKTETPIQAEEEQDNKIEDIQKGQARVPEFITPKKLVKAMVDLLPDEVWREDTIFFDPACKSGRYLREIYDRLMESPRMKAKIPDRNTRSIHILNNQLYGIALSNAAFERTKVSLLEFGNNIRVVPNYTDLLKAFNSKDYRDDHLMKQFIKDQFGDTRKYSKKGEDMEFDIIIGNPPYQESTGGGNGGSGVSIYQNFVEQGMEVAKQGCFIIPARWMSDRPNGIDADTLKRLRMREDIKNLIDFQDKQVFKGVNIAGGVCIIQIENGYKGERLDTFGVIIRDKTYKSIIEKVVRQNFDSLASYIDSDCYRSGDYMNSGWQDFDAFQSEEYSIKYYCSNKDSILGYAYVRPDQVIKNQHTVNEYKVALQSSSPTDGMVINEGVVLEPNTCCSRTYVVLHHSELINSKEKSENAVKYLKTKFARACIKAIKNTQNASKQAYRFVPLQDFTINSDIDWSQSITDIDQQLYQKYGLTAEEIQYIESTIKSMDSKPKYTGQDAAAAYVNNLINNQNQ